MKRSVKIILSCAGLTALTSTMVIACGPFFNWQLLDNRQQTLLNLPATDSFTQKIKNLGEVTEEEKRNLYSANNVTDSTANRLTCQNTDEAYQKAAILFHNKQWEEADAAFSILAYNSPPAQQVCAKFTLGRIEKAMGRYEDAVNSFNSTAYLVAHGAPDPLQLGIIAYGEAAGVILDQIGTRIITKYNPGDPRSGTTYWHVGPIKPDSLLQLQRAVKFYLKQQKIADAGKVSLMIVLQGLSDPENANAKILLDQAVRDPLLRKLLLAYVLTDEYNEMVYSKAHTQNILNAFLNANTDAKDYGEDMGSLAAFTYQNGDVDKAQLFAEYEWNKNHTALSAWILAKTALKKGDEDQAQEYYHQAIAHFNDGTLRLQSKQRLQGENAVLNLSQGNFVQAMEALWPVRDLYWGDVVYLAENVLTPDELRKFVNVHTDVPKDPQAQCNSQVQYDNYYDDKTGDFHGYNLAGRSLALRQLLARRLMRVGRLEEALPYFAQPSDRNCKSIPEHVKIERNYIRYTTDMRRSFWATDRAKAAWRAATLLRDHGMELMGTEGYPDQSPGTYSYGIGQIMGPENDENNRPWSVPEEQERTGVSWPNPNHRFHYRYIAVENVLYAAQLIPHQSQAYAAMLCRANGWMQDTSNFSGAPALYYYPNAQKEYPDMDPYMAAEEVAKYKLGGDSEYAYAKAKTLYDLYLRNGAAVSFADQFGHDCPEPEFNAIPKLKRDLFWKSVRSSLHFLKK